MQSEDNQLYDRWSAAAAERAKHRERAGLLSTEENKARARVLWDRGVEFTGGYLKRRFGYQIFDNLAPPLRVVVRLFAYFMHIDKEKLQTEAAEKLAAANAKNAALTQDMRFAQSGTAQDARTIAHLRLKLADTERRLLAAADKTQFIGVDYGSPDGDEFAITVRIGEKNVLILRDSEISKKRQEWKAKTLMRRYAGKSSWCVDVDDRSAMPQSAWGLSMQRAQPLEARVNASLYVTSPGRKLKSASPSYLKRTDEEWELAAQNLSAAVPERHGFRWTRSEEEKLLRDYRAQKRLSHLVRMHQREWEAIVLRLAKLAGGWSSHGMDEAKFNEMLRSFYFTPIDYARDWVPGGHSVLRYRSAVRDAAAKYTSFQHPWSKYEVLRK